MLMLTRLWCQWFPPLPQRTRQGWGTLCESLTNENHSYWQTAPASVVNVLLSENHPLAAIDGAP